MKRYSIKYRDKYKFEVTTMKECRQTVILIIHVDGSKDRNNTTHGKKKVLGSVKESRKNFSNRQEKVSEGREREREKERERERENYQ